MRRNPPTSRVFRSLSSTAILGVDMMQCDDIKTLEDREIRPTMHDMVGEDHAAFIR